MYQQPPNNQPAPSQGWQSAPYPPQPQYYQQPQPPPQQPHKKFPTWVIILGVTIIVLLNVLTFLMASGMLGK